MSSRKVTSNLTDVKSGNTIPLKSINFDVSVVDQLGTVTITQDYANTTSKPLEAVFTFPVDNNATITDFRVQTSTGKILLGEIQPKSQAFDNYSDSLAEGNGAYLLEQKRGDVLSLYLGNFDAKSSLKIIITYLTEVRVESDSLRFTIPLTIAPRYEYTGQQLAQEDKISDIKYGNNDYNIGLDFKFETIFQIESVESVTHEIEISSENFEDDKKRFLYKTNDIDNTGCDFVFVIQLRNLEDEIKYTFEHKDNKVGMIFGLNPKCIHTQLKNQNQEKNISEKKKKEIYDIKFVVDRSGSMAGSRIETVKRALQIFLRSLPENCYFNLYGFGSNYDHLWRSSSKYSNDTLQAASDYVSKLKADLGGTELKALFKHLVGNKSANPGIIFLLTDGEISNTKETISVISNQQFLSKNRVYTFGIGENVSHELIDSLAKVGNGTSEYFIPNSNEKLDVKIIRQLNTALGHQNLQKLEVSLASNANKIQHIIPDHDLLYFNKKLSKMMIYLLIDSKNINDNLIFQVGKNELLKINLKEVLNDKNKEKKDVMKMVVGKQIMEWSTEPSKFEKEITNLSLKYQIMSTFTSFLIVEEKQEKTSKSMKMVKIPLQKPKTQTKRSVNNSSQPSGFRNGYRFSNSYKSTIGADFKMSQLNINGKPIKAQIWDTAGQDRFSSMTRVYFRGANGYFFVYDISNRSSFDKISHWVDIVRANITDSQPTFILLGNKVDLCCNPPQREHVSEAEGRQLSYDLGMDGFYQVSGKECTNLQEAFEDMYINIYQKDSTSIFKIVPSGESGVGKTTLTGRLGDFYMNFEGNVSEAKSNSVDNSSTQTSTTSSSPGFFGSLWSYLTWSTPAEASPTQPTTNTSNVENNNNNIKKIERGGVKTKNVSAVATTVVDTQKIDFDAVVLLQRADGLWDMGAKICTLLQKSEKVLLDAMPTERGGSTVKKDLQCWITLICVAKLDQNPAMDLVVKKANTTVKKVLNDDSTFTAWVKKSKTV